MSIWQQVIVSIDSDAAVKVVSAFLTAIIGLTWKRYAEGRPRVVQYFVHSGAVPIAAGGAVQAAFAVHTHALVIRNTGKKSAENLRLGHHHLPAFAITPPVQYQLNGANEILVPRLVPGESLTLTYVYFPPLTWNQIHAYAKTDEMLVQHLRVQPQVQPSRVVLLLVGVLMFTGAATLVYWSLRLLYLYLIA